MLVSSYFRRVIRALFPESKLSGTNLAQHPYGGVNIQKYMDRPPVSLGNGLQYIVDWCFTFLWAHWRCSKIFTGNPPNDCLATSLSISLSLYLCFSISLSLCLSVSLSLCLSISLSLCLSISLSLCLSVSLSLYLSISLSLYLSISLSLYLSVSLSLYLSISLSLCLSVSLSLYLYLSISLSLYLSISLSLFLSVSLSLYLSISLSRCLSVSLSLCLSVSLSLYLSVSLSLYLSISLSLYLSISLTESKQGGKTQRTRKQQAGTHSKGKAGHETKRSRHKCSNTSHWPPNASTPRIRQSSVSLLAQRAPCSRDTSLEAGDKATAPHTPHTNTNDKRLTDHTKHPPTHTHTPPLPPLGSTRLRRGPQVGLGLRRYIYICIYIYIFSLSFSLSLSLTIYLCRHFEQFLICNLACWTDHLCETHCHWRIDFIFLAERQQEEQEKCQGFKANNQEAWKVCRANRNDGLRRCWPHSAFCLVLCAMPRTCCVCVGLR